MTISLLPPCIPYTTEEDEWVIRWREVEGTYEPCAFGAAAAVMMRWLGYFAKYFEVTALGIQLIAVSTIPDSIQGSDSLNRIYFGSAVDLQQT